MKRASRAVVAALTTAMCLAVAPVATEAAPVPGATPHQSQPTASRVTAGPDIERGIQIQDAKDRADRQVAAARRGVAAQTDAVARASARASVAEQNYLTQLGVQAHARRAEAAASERLAAARAEYDYDYRAFSAAAVSAYESGTGSFGAETVGTLLVVDDPSAVLGAATAHDMLADHQADVVSRIQLDVQRVRDAETASRAALARVSAATAQLAHLQRAAAAALAESKRGLEDLQTRLGKAKATQREANKALSSFLGGWSAADPLQAGRLNQRYAAIALEVGHTKPAPARDHWTAAMGATVVNRALQYLGTPYAWAGGNTTGPTNGVCVAGAASHDCRVTGFDCSGLALYAWAPYQPLAHSAAAQYLAGEKHPSPSELLPGDLVFWSSDGTARLIHHVAIYVGDGNVIQAPQSGDIVRITPLQSVSRGYFGATRPLS